MHALGLKTPVELLRRLTLPVGVLTVPVAVVSVTVAVHERGWLTTAETGEQTMLVDVVLGVATRENVPLLPE